MTKFISVFLLAFMVLTVGCSNNIEADEEASDDMKKIFPIENVRLNNGFEMPMLGLGTWTMSDDIAEASVYEAIKLGYRLIDTARYYDNEVGVGRGVRRAIDDGLITREEVFVTSKIVPRGRSDYDRDIDQSLSALGLEYIDLMLVHQSGAGELELYRALERGVQDGRLRSIGISNYYTPEEFERINRIATITPAVVQNENHPFYQNTELQKYLERYGTVVESWYPLGGRGHTREMLNEPTLVSIAKKHGKSAAQVILRWHMQANYVVIPGTVHHIAEDFDVFDFALDGEDMESIARLNRNARYEVW